MSNNLKVNAKTKPLELKKKHNLLVEEVDTKVSVQEVENLIQADKNILSKIVYDEEDDRLILPKYVMPLRLTISSTDCYFDYNDMVIYNNNGEYIADFSYERDHIEISSVIDISENPNVQQIDYIFSVNGMETINTYYLYHPITSSVELYKHTITLRNANEDEVNLIGISTSGTVITNIQDIDLSKFISIIGFSESVEGNENFTLIDLANGSMRYWDPANNQISVINMDTVYSDVVTKL